MLPDLTLDEPRMIVLTGAAALVAGVVRGFSGFGGPALMALVLTQFYNPLSVLTKVVIIDAASYLLLVPSTAREFNRRVIAIVTLATVAGLPIGTYLLVETDPVVMKRAIAGAVAACVFVMLFGGRFRASPSIAVHIAVGLLAGVVLGATYIALVAMIFFSRSLRQGQRAEPMRCSGASSSPVFSLRRTWLWAIFRSATCGARPWSEAPIWPVPLPAYGGFAGPASANSGVPSCGCCLVLRWSGW